MDAMKINKSRSHHRQQEQEEIALDTSETNENGCCVHLRVSIDAVNRSLS